MSSRVAPPLTSLVAAATLVGCGALDTTPPDLALRGPEGTVRERVAVEILAADTAPGLARRGGADARGAGGAPRHGRALSRGYDEDSAKVR